MGKFRKKPVVIEAVQFKPLNVTVADNGFPADFEPPMWLRDAFAKGKQAGGIWEKGPAKDDPFGECLRIGTLEGEHRCDPGDFIIQGVKGEIYPCKPDIFAATYEPADAG